MTLEEKVYQEFLKLAEKKQGFFCTNQFLIQELIRQGYSAPYDDLKKVADRIYNKLETHPMISRALDGTLEIFN
jgi:hypothetical protein